MRTWIILASLLIPCCHSNTNRSTLSRRVAKDLSCPEASLRLIDLGRDAVGAVGCGKKATYVRECLDKAGRKCGWKQNSADDVVIASKQP